MYNISEDISTLTTIPRNSVDKLLNTMEWCICQNVDEQINNKEVLTEVNIGIGVIAILLEDESVKYRFTPSRSFDKNIKKTLTTKQNPVEIELEKSLVNRILHAYKDIL